MEKEKTFNYYYDEEKNIIYVPRNILELSRKNNIVIEGTPKIIDDGNYYSIHYKDLKKLEEVANIKGKEIVFNKKEKAKNIVIVYKLVDSDELYTAEDFGNNDKKVRIVMGKICYKTTIEELESIRNKKFIIVTVYQTGRVAEKENEASEIIVCNLNDLLFVKESDLNKISINTKGRKKIRVDGTIYVESIEEEVYKLKELTHSNITIKDIVKKENTSGKRI